MVQLWVQPRHSDSRLVLFTSPSEHWIVIACLPLVGGILLWSWMMSYLLFDTQSSALNGCPILLLIRWLVFLGLIFFQKMGDNNSKNSIRHPPLQQTHIRPSLSFLSKQFPQQVDYSLVIDRLPFCLTTLLYASKAYFPSVVLCADQDSGVCVHKPVMPVASPILIKNVKTA